MNAKKFLADHVIPGSSPYPKFVSEVSELVNDSAALNDRQQTFVLGLVREGPGEHYSDRLMKIVTLINSFR